MSPGTQPRNTFGLIAIALFLGAPTLMLWMGRFRLAVLYFLASIALLAFFLGAAFAGLPPVPFLASLGIDTFAFVALLPIALVALLHAFMLNKAPPQRPWHSRWFPALVALPLGAFAVLFVPALIVRTFFFHPYSAPSASMMPALIPGDYFFVSKRAYQSHPPERGDIAVFKLPADPSIVYVKRVIGLPGDRIQMTGGVLQINGAAVKMEPAEIDPRYRDAIKPEMSGGDPPYFRETLPNGRSYLIIDSVQDSSADNTDVFEVPANHYFMMGDNRDNSYDSRFEQTGYIPAENFIGSMSFRFFNERGIPLVNRP